MRTDIKAYILLGQENIINIEFPQLSAIIENKKFIDKYKTIEEKVNEIKAEIMQCNIIRPRDNKELIDKFFDNTNNWEFILKCYYYGYYLYYQFHFIIENDRTDELQISGSMIHLTIPEMLDQKFDCVNIDSIIKCIFYIYLERQCYLEHNFDKANGYKIFTESERHLIDYAHRNNIMG